MQNPKLIVLMWNVQRTAGQKHLHWPRNIRKGLERGSLELRDGAPVPSGPGCKIQQEDAVHGDAVDGQVAESSGGLECAGK